MDVVGLSDSGQAISAGYDHTCALTEDGGVKCWGGNWGGNSGMASPETRLTPVDVSRLGRWDPSHQRRWRSQLRPDRNWRHLLLG